MYHRVIYRSTRMLVCTFMPQHPCTFWQQHPCTSPHIPSPPAYNLLIAPDMLACIKSFIHFSTRRTRKKVAPTKKKRKSDSTHTHSSRKVNTGTLMSLTCWPGAWWTPQEANGAHQGTARVSAALASPQKELPELKLASSQKEMSELKCQRLPCGR